LILLNTNEEDVKERLLLLLTCILGLDLSG
jgi:hypothetical protein